MSKGRGGPWVLDFRWIHVNQGFITLSSMLYKGRENSWGRGIVVLIPLHTYSNMFTLWEIEILYTSYFDFNESICVLYAIKFHSKFNLVGGVIIYMYSNAISECLFWFAQNWLVYRKDRLVVVLATGTV